MSRYTAVTGCIASTAWLRGRLILAAVFTYLAYNYLVGVMGHAFNSMSLLWTALFSTGVLGVAVTLHRLDTAALPEKLATGFPRRSLAVYMLGVAVALLSQYLAQALTVHDTGRLPVALENGTTLELAALELGLMAPLHVVGGVLLWRRRAWGYVMSIILVFAAAMTLLPLTVGQVLQHVSFGADNVWGIAQVSLLTLVACALSFLACQRAETLPPGG